MNKATPAQLKHARKQLRSYTYVMNLKELNSIERQILFKMYRSYFASHKIIRVRSTKCRISSLQDIQKMADRIIAQINSFVGANKLQQVSYCNYSYGILVSGVKTSSDHELIKLHQRSIREEQRMRNARLRHLKQIKKEKQLAEQRSKKLAVQQANQRKLSFDVLIRSKEDAQTAIDQLKKAFKL